MSSSLDHLWVFTGELTVALNLDLLYIHRVYFALALRQMPSNPLQHAYAPSVLATYRSACRLIMSLKSFYAVHPDFASTGWYFWSGIYSSCVRRLLSRVKGEC